MKALSALSGVNAIVKFFCSAGAAPGFHPGPHQGLSAPGPGPACRWTFCLKNALPRVFQNRPICSSYPKAILEDAERLLFVLVFGVLFIVALVVVVVFVLFVVVVFVVVVFVVVVFVLFFVVALLVALGRLDLPPLDNAIDERLLLLG